MNIIKKYWDSVYIYVLLLVPGLCMCAGIYWTSCKLAGWYTYISWTKLVLFDCSQLLYLAISIFFIYKNKKDSSYIPEHLNLVKAFVVTILLIQYNVIMYLFSAEHVAECTFLFFLILTFLFDSKLMFINIILYGISFWVRILWTNLLLNPRSQVTEDTRTDTVCLLITVSPIQRATGLSGPLPLPMTDTFSKKWLSRYGMRTILCRPGFR